LKSNNKRGSSGRFFTGLRYLNSILQLTRAFSSESSALFQLPLFRFASHGLVLSLALIVVIATPPQVSPNAPQKNLNADSASSASSKAPGERSLPTAEPDYLRATPLLTTDYTDPQQVARGVSYLPTNSIIEKAEGQFVFVAEKGTARERKIKTGLSNWDTTEVVEGVKEGDEVITSLEIAKLKDGMKVTTNKR